MDEFDKGQHMLLDSEVIEREIEEAQVTKKDNVMEIGAGTGFLTRELVKECKTLTVFEIDDKFKETLQEIKKKNKNLKVIFDDCLNHDWRTYDKIVANVPYYLSEAILRKAIRDDINSMVLIVGANFKELLFSSEKPGLLGRKFYDIREVLLVPAESFDPMPRTDSYLLHFIKKEDLTEKDRAIIGLYNAKGKVKNYLIQLIRDSGKTNKEAKEIVKSLGLQEQVLEKPVLKVTGKLLGILEEVIGNIYSKR